MLICFPPTEKIIAEHEFSAFTVFKTLNCTQLGTYAWLTRPPGWCGSGVGWTRGNFLPSFQLSFTIAPAVTEYTTALLNTACFLMISLIFHTGAQSLKNLCYALIHTAGALLRVRLTLDGRGNGLKKCQLKRKDEIVRQYLLPLL